jgi:hypothetical protein
VTAGLRSILRGVTGVAGVSDAVEDASTCLVSSGLVVGRQRSCVDFWQARATAASFYRETERGQANYLAPLEVNFSGEKSVETLLKFYHVVLKLIVFTLNVTTEVDSL